MRERERETERQRETERERDRERQRQKETERDRERDTEQLTGLYGLMRTAKLVRWSHSHTVRTLFDSLTRQPLLDHRPSVLTSPQQTDRHTHQVKSSKELSISYT